MQKPTNPGDGIWNHFPIWPTSKRQCSSALIIPRARYQTTSDSSSSPGPLKFLKIQLSKLDYTTLPCCSHRNYNKAPCPCFYRDFFCHQPTCTSHVALCGVLCPPGSYSNKLSFQWQSSPDLLHSLSLTDDKNYILKETRVHVCMLDQSCPTL